jgi:hypothetical protein
MLPYVTVCGIAQLTTGYVASLVHSHTHSASVHILKEVVVAGGRRRQTHAHSWFIFGVLVLVLALYWKSIIEEFFVGFSSP